MRTLLILALFLLPVPLRADRVTVFTAASLSTALDEVATAFKAETGHDIVAVYAGSSALARQISQGAEADIFIAANPGWMDHVAALGFVVPGTRRDLMGNRLVLVSDRPGDEISLLDIETLKVLIGQDRVATALTDAVPVGLYAKAALQHFGLWPDIVPRLVQADNARAALAFVALGEVPFGIVYASDAVAEPRVHLRATFPEAAHPPILYPAAALTERPGVRDFLTYLRSAEASQVFAAQGFVTFGK